MGVCTLYTEKIAVFQGHFGLFKKELIVIKNQLYSKFQIDQFQQIFLLNLTYNWLYRILYVL